MARLSPITIGLPFLASLALAGAVYSVFSSRLPRATHTANPEARDSGLQPEPYAVGSGPADQTAILKRLPASAVIRPLAIIEDKSVTDEAVAAAPPSPGGLLARDDLPRPRVDRRAMMQAWRRYSQVRRADELAFESLKIAEPARAAIRKINDEHRPKMRDLASTPPDGGAEAVERDETVRRVAIDGVLGADAAKEFYTAEASAKLKWLNQLPPPSGGPDAQIPPERSSTGGSFQGQPDPTGASTASRDDGGTAQTGLPSTANPTPRPIPAMAPPPTEPAPSDGAN